MKGFAFGFNETEIRVYDPETKTVIATYDTITKASSRLGLSTGSISDACSKKVRRYSPVLKKEIALRLAKRETK